MYMELPSMRTREVTARNGDTWHGRRPGTLERRRWRSPSGFPGRRACSLVIATPQMMQFHPAPLGSVTTLSCQGLLDNWSVRLVCSFADWLRVAISVVPSESFLQYGR